MNLDIDNTVKHIRRGKNISPHVLVGPVVWQISGDNREWYFVIASGDQTGARFDCIKSAKKPLIEEFRAALYLGLIQKPPIVVHDFGDELEFARWSEATWPSPKTRKIRAGIEAEQAASQ